MVSGRYCGMVMRYMRPEEMEVRMHAAGYLTGKEDS